MSQVGLGPTRPDTKELEHSPIPQDWVLAGEPMARGRELVRSPDGTCTTAHWDCTAGVFRWFFHFEETVHILEGAVRIRDAAGQDLHLHQGDTAVMPANTWMVWHVDRYVRKLAVCRYPVPKPLGRLVRSVQNLKARMGLQQGPDETLPLLA